MLYDLDWKLPRKPYVVVGPQFLAVPIDAKSGFAETVNCFLTAGKADYCVDFDLLHWNSGRTIGRFANCRYRPA